VKTQPCGFRVVSIWFEMSFGKTKVVLHFACLSRFVGTWTVDSEVFCMYGKCILHSLDCVSFVSI
jgi:hypothetical protein